uniref:Putative secreted protein n=1 Tax=Ixodes ricinus TaxID=34613 RepID=V5IJQ0_IXORI
MSTPTNVFYTLVAFAFMWEVSLAYPPYGDVEIVDGKCKWQNCLVPDGGSLNLENSLSRPWTNDQPVRKDDGFLCPVLGVRSHTGNPYN